MLAELRLEAGRCDTDDSPRCLAFDFSSQGFFISSLCRGARKPELIRAVRRRLS